MAEHDDSFGARSIVLLAKASAKRRSDSKHLECVVRNCRALKVLGFVAPGERRTPAQEPGDVFERLRVLTPIFQIGRRCPLALRPAALLMILPDHREALRITIWQRLKQHRVDDAENRRVGADTK